MNVTIRKAQARDIPELVKMNDTFNGVGCSTYEHMKESLEANRNEVVLVAICNGAIVGFACG